VPYQKTLVYVVTYRLHWKARLRFFTTLTVAEKMFDDRLTRLADARAQAKIAVRINWLAAGNFGDCKSLRHGLSELRIDWGPGYRVYYAMIGRECVLLLCGGDKRKQSADIGRAPEYLSDYKERAHET
jgi:putative addiction module killer protein